MRVASAAQFCSTTRSLRQCAPSDWTLALGFGAWRFFSDVRLTWSGDPWVYSPSLESTEIKPDFVICCSTREQGSRLSMLLHPSDLYPTVILAAGSACER